MVQVVSESLVDADVKRWASRGFVRVCDFLPEVSLCVLMDGLPVGFVVSSKGWIDQVGVVPARRRLGLASALVTEAATRMRAAGTPFARLHVNTNNAGALAAWRALGWRPVGRRGRFERRPHPQ